MSLDEHLYKIGMIASHVATRKIRTNPLKISVVPIHTHPRYPSCLASLYPPSGDIPHHSSSHTTCHSPLLSDWQLQPD